MKTKSKKGLDFSCSDQMSDSIRSDAILTLGRRLVEELGLEETVDTLGRWMAHYIADLIIRAETASGEEKQSAEVMCFNSIIMLWRYRAGLPMDERPLHELEPVIRAMKSLDPDDATPRYFRSIRPQVSVTKEESEAHAWLKMVAELDCSAKILIGYYLNQAARAAVDKSQEWIKLAEAADCSDDITEIMIRIVSSAKDLDVKPNSTDEARRQVNDRLKRLESFISLAEELVIKWQQELQSLSSSALEN